MINYKSEFKKKGGRIITDTRATDLIVEEGKVVGIKATQANGTRLVLSVNNGVVLASGGFGANTKMIKKIQHLLERDCR
ncbi:hypothetical protein OS11_13520 [Dickeya oryzae]